MNNKGSKCRLFICNNPYQVIISIMLVIQFSDTEQIKNDILITDNFNGAEKVYKNLFKEKFFNNVFFSKINNILSAKKITKKLKKIYYALNENSMIINCINNSFYNNKYDEIFYNNDNLFFYGIVRYLYKKNNNLKIFRYEEGYSSYIRPFCSLKAQKIFNLKNCCKFSDLLSGMYYFKKDYIQFTPFRKVYTIKPCEITDMIKNIIKKTFSVEKLSIDLKNKFIIFEESFFNDYGYTADERLYKKIIDYVGKENVVIKMHPRSTFNRYKKLGVQILENSEIPWEAFLMLNNFENTKFISLASGSVINSRLMLGDTSKSFLLYKCADAKVPTLDKTFEKFMSCFIKDRNEGLCIPENIEEFYTYISKEKE